MFKHHSKDHALLSAIHSHQFAAAVVRSLPQADHAVDVPLHKGGHPQRHGKKLNKQ